MIHKTIFVHSLVCCLYPQHKHILYHSEHFLVIFVWQTKTVLFHESLLYLFFCVCHTHIIHTSWNPTQFWVWQINNFSVIPSHAISYLLLRDIHLLCLWWRGVNFVNRQLPSFRLYLPLSEIQCLSPQRVLMIVYKLVRNYTFNLSRRLSFLWTVERKFTDMKIHSAQLHIGWNFCDHTFGGMKHHMVCGPNQHASSFNNPCHKMNRTLK